MQIRRLMLTLTTLLAGCSGAPSAAPPSPEPVEVPAKPQPVPVAAAASGRVEVLWDTWGVPHIFAEDETALLWAFGQAQMESHGDLLLRLYGQARGRAAEYWGEEYVESDRWVLTNGIPARAREWYRQQDHYMRAYIDAFAAGLNAYADVNRALLSDEVEVVLPVTSEDVLAHIQRVIHFTFMVEPGSVASAVRAWSATGRGDDADLSLSGLGAGERAGSNGWAISPSRSASGHAMLLANPHLPWGDLFTWYEAQLVLPDMDAYGAALVGFPLLGIAFNDHLGWTHTVNTLDGADLYSLTLQDNGYVYDGNVRTFTADTTVLRVRQSDGSLREQPLIVKHSVHGPVVAERENRALALRVAGLDRPHLFEQTWRMLRAQNLAQFEAALSRLQIPMFTVLYADREGHILHVFNGTVPVRSSGGFGYWSGVVPGHASEMFWSRVHGYADLPRVLDPESGWLQNANDPPWTTTFPPPLRPDRYPINMAPTAPLAFRPQRSARMLAEDTLITFDELAEYKQDTYVESADHILEDVVVAARMHGTERAQRAARVLSAWDRKTDARSRGAVLYDAFFRLFARQRGPNGTPFDVPWSPTAPFTTPDGIGDPQAAAAALETAAEQVESRYGALDVPWGDVYRLRRDSVDLPAEGGPGGLGIFRVLGFQNAGDNRFAANSGDSYVALIEFGNPVRARVLTVYGNASQPHSPHRTDQMVLFARKELREAWITRPDVEAHLAKRQEY